MMTNRTPATTRRHWRRELLVVLGAVALGVVGAYTLIGGADWIHQQNIEAAGQPWWDADPEQRPAAADPTSTSFVPTVTERREGLNVLTREDDGTYRGLIRWEREHVDVYIADPADAATVELIDHVLDWVADATGVMFERSDDPDAPVVIRLGNKVQPSVVYSTEGSEIVHAVATFDPAWERHVWEELAHVAGPYGDHSSRPDAMFTPDQTALRPGPFDVWILQQLYRPAVLPDDTSELVAR